MRLDGVNVTAVEFLATMVTVTVALRRRRLACPLVKAAKTIHFRRDLILNAVEHWISNGRVEGLNTKVRLIIRRAYGFHSPDAALALVMLGAGPINLQLPHERTHVPGA